MKRTPETRKDIRDMLLEHLGLLCEAAERCEPKQLCTISECIVKLAGLLYTGTIR